MGEYTGMELIKAKLSELGSALSGIKELQVTAKGKAEVTLHTRSQPSSPKFRAEVTEDGTTVNVADILLVGAAVCAVSVVCSLICDLLD